MSSGPSPKPTRFKVVTGNPGHRKLPTNEPKPQPIAPNCPEWLNATARAEWRRVVPELLTIGLLTRIDQAALASYCVAYGDLVEAREALDDLGQTVTITTERGEYVQQRPEVAIANNAMRLIKAFCQEFGMTPSSRGRMSMPDQPAPNDSLLD